jgi:hypothetical protein
MSDAAERPLTPSVFARLAQATRYAITGVSPQSWFGPQQPLEPQAPPDVIGRQFDYAFGANLNYVPRAEGGISFAELRALADARCPTALTSMIWSFVSANVSTRSHHDSTGFSIPGSPKVCPCRKCAHRDRIRVAGPREFASAGHF